MQGTQDEDEAAAAAYILECANDRLCELKALNSKFVKKVFLFVCFLLCQTFSNFVRWTIWL